MQSVCMKEARKGGVLRSAEETTLVQLIFGGYLRSKVFFAQSLQLFILIYSGTLDQLCGEANLYYTPTDYSFLFRLSVPRSNVQGAMLVLSNVSPCWILLLKQMVTLARSMRHLCGLHPQKSWMEKTNITAAGFVTALGLSSSDLLVPISANFICGP